MANYSLKRRNDRNPLAWLYRQNITAAWSFFPDKAAESLKTMKDFLTDGGRINTSGISFTDDNGKPTNYAEVKKLENNKFSVRINAGERSHTLSETDFIPFDQQFKYYADRQTVEFNTEAFKMDLIPKVRHYKENADQHTADEFNRMLAEKTSEGNIEMLVRSREGENIVVHFID